VDSRLRGNDNGVCEIGFVLHILVSRFLILDS
jgi:hypothetical protein